jgi:hypothetical protein
MTNLTYQQQFVLERLIKANEKVVENSTALRVRANFVTAASTVIVGLITTAKFLPKSVPDKSSELILLALVCLCSIGIYFFAALIWKGGTTELASTSDVDKLYDSYIAQDEDNAYHNFLVDEAAAFDKNRQENYHQAKRLDYLVWAFMLQLFLLATAIGWSSVNVQ